MLVMVMLLSISVTDIAAATKNDFKSQNLISGPVKSAYVPSVNETGVNLKNDIEDGSRYLAKNSTPTITSAEYVNEGILINGNVNGIDFNISGVFSGISDNGNVLIFTSKDTLDNFRVVYCAIEREIVDSTLYFKSFSNKNKNYQCVTKLYLASDSGNDYIMTEMFGNFFPKISEKTIAALPENHQLGMFWYAREFKPTKISTIKEEQLTRAGNPSYGILKTYFFTHLGMEIKHYMRFWEDCDIRDVTRDGSSTASATIRISDKWVTAPLPNDSSTTQSTLSLRNVSLFYLTRTNTAVTKMQSIGTVTENGIIVSSFKYGLGVGLKGLSTTASLSFTWQPGNDNKDTGVDYQAHTNSGGSYWREAEAKLKSAQYLNSIGNKFTSNWEYSSYTSSTSTDTARLAFKYTVYNLLDYTQSHDATDERAISVNII